MQAKQRDSNMVHEMREASPLDSSSASEVGLTGGTERPASVEASTTPITLDAEEPHDLEKRSRPPRPPRLLSSNELKDLSEGSNGEQVNGGNGMEGTAAAEEVSPFGRRSLAPVPTVPAAATLGWVSEIQEESEDGLSRASLVTQSSVHSDVGILPQRVTKDSPWLTFLEAEYARSTVEGGSKLDSWMREVRKAKRNQSTLRGSALYALLRNRYVQVTMFLFLWFEVYLFVNSVRLFSRYRKTVVAVHFRVLAAVDSSAPPSLTNVEAMGVLFGDCELRYDHVERTTDALQVHFAQPARMDGWFLTANGTDPALDPAQFEIGIVEAGGSDAHSSPVVLPFNNFRAGIWERDATADAWDLERTATRGRRTFQLQPPQPARIGTAAVAGVLVAATGMVVALSVRDRLLEARLCAGAGLAATAVAAAGVAAALLALREGGLSFMWLRTWVSCSVVAPAVLDSRLKRFFVSSVALASAAHLALLVADLAFRVRTEPAHVGTLLWLTHETYVAGAGIALAGSLWWVQRRQVQEVEASIVAGGEALEAAWREVKGALGARAGRVLREVQERARRMQRHGVRRPQHRVLPAGEGAGAGRRRARLLSLAGEAHGGGGAVVRSLDQLYAQARCCRVLLQGRVKALALESGALLPITESARTRQDPPAVLVAWARAVEEPDGESAAAVAWAPLKPTERAIEKALNNYGGDVSRLVDLCRETLVLPDLAAVVRCLDALAGDRSVVVERIVNSLRDREVDSAETGGFRGVVISLRIVNGAARALGVHGHVCELVLVPRALAERMSEEEYEAFRRLRDARQASGAVSVPVWKLLRRWVGRACRGWRGEGADAPPPGANGSFGQSGVQQSRASSLGRTSVDHRAELASQGSAEATPPPISQMQHSSSLELSSPSQRSPSISSTPAVASTPLQRVQSSLGRQGSGLLLYPQGLQHQRSGNLATGPGSGGGVFSALSSSHSNPATPGAMMMTSPSGARPGLLRGVSAASGLSHQTTASGRMLSVLRRGSEAVVHLMGRDRRKSTGNSMAGSHSEMVRLREEFEPQARGSVWFKLMERLYRARTTRMEERLNDKKYRISVAVQHSDALAVFDTSYPIAAAMCKPMFLATAVLIGVTYLAAAGVSLHRLAHTGRVTTAWLWFNVLELRGGLPVSGAEAVKAMGVMDKACPRGLPLASVSSVRGWQLQLPAPERLDGFFFETQGPGQDRNLDPVEYAVQQSADGIRWEPIAGSHRTFLLGGYQRWPRTAWHSVETPAGGGELVAIDFRPPVFAWLSGAVPDVVLGLAWLLLALCGVAHRRQWGLETLQLVEGGQEFWLRGGKIVLLSGLWVGALCLLVAAAAMRGEGYSDFAALHWLWALVSTGAALSISLAPQLLVEAVALWGLAGVVLNLVSELSAEVAPVESGGGEHYAPPVVLLVVGVCLAAARWRSRMESLREVLEDVKRYDRVWEDVHHFQERGLRKVERQMEVLQSRCIDKRALAQQFVPTPLSRAARRAASAGSAGARVRRLLTGEASGTSMLHRWFSPGQHGSMLSLMPRSRAGGSAEDLTQPGRASAEAGEAGWEGGSPTARRPSRPESPSRGRWRYRARHFGEVSADSSPERLRNNGGGDENGPGGASGLRRAAESEEGGGARAGNAVSRRSSRVGVEDGGRSQGSADGSGEEGGGAGGRGGGGRGRKRVTGAMSLSALVRRRHPGGRGGWEGRGEERLGDIFQRRWSSASSESGSSPRRLSPMAARGSFRAALRTQGTLLSRMVREGGAGRVVKELLTGKSGRDGQSMPEMELTGREARAPVECLDQLYAQAEGVLPHLKRKVQAWAKESRGMFPVRGGRALGEGEGGSGAGSEGGGFALWEALLEEHGSGEAAEERVKWASVKAAGRAVEKTLRSYDGKVWRLLDVCRQSIVFGSASDLADCLEAVAADSEVEVLHVKNRFHKDYDAKSLSLGYRDVNINLRFITPACRRLGIHLHICELQLLLKDFAQLKNDAGHKRYVAFRNARGM